jgi:hypothetical protein
VQPFPPSGDPTSPGPDVPPTGPSRPSVLGPAVIGAAVVVFALVVGAIVVITTQLGRSPSEGDLAADTPAFQTKSPSTAATTTEGTEAATTTENPPPTDPPTSPSTTSPAQALSAELGEDVMADQLRIPAKPAAKGSFKFLESVGGAPVSFDACRTIHYVVHVGSGPANGLNLVTEAIRRLSTATGLQFQYDGPSNTVPQWSEPSKSRNVTDLSAELTPVFIGWATKNETDIWAHSDKDVLGVGAPETIVFSNGGAKLYATGHAVLLPNANVADSFGPGVTEGNLLLHELAHVVGLDHVTGTGEIMAPDLTAQEPDGYGPGDLQGLYALGASKGCASTWLLEQMHSGAGG